MELLWKYKDAKGAADQIVDRLVRSSLTPYKRGIASMRNDVKPAGIKNKLRYRPAIRRFVQFSLNIGRFCNLCFQHQIKESHVSQKLIQFVKILLLNFAINVQLCN